MLNTSRRSVSLTTRSGLLVVRPGPVVLRATRGVNRLDNHLANRYGRRAVSTSKASSWAIAGGPHDRQDEPEERGSAAPTGHARSAARSFRPRRFVHLLRLVGVRRLFVLLLACLLC